MDKKAELIARGHHAQQLLADPLLNEALTSMEGEIMRLWRSSEPGETSNRERLWIAVTLLGGLKQSLQNMVMSGTLAEADLRRIFAPLDVVNRPQA